MHILMNLPWPLNLTRFLVLTLSLMSTVKTCYLAWTMMIMKLTTPTLDLTYPCVELGKTLIYILSLSFRVLLVSGFTPSNQLRDLIQERMISAKKKGRDFESHRYITATNIYLFIPNYQFKSPTSCLVVF